MSDSDNDKPNRLPRSDPAAVSGTVPLAARQAHEIRKPKDWQAFQRGCVHLFKGELNDPHVQEYGRHGQKQRGIDLLGRRDGKPDHWVGIQCKRYEESIGEREILEECRAALTLEQKLKELIFATTAPNDRKMTDAAARVEAILRGEGHDLTVVVYGWGELENRIAKHDDAYAFFTLSSVASSAPIATTPLLNADEQAIELLASKLHERMLARTALVPSGADDRSARVAEDPALHARIDIYRDIHGKEHQPVVAQKGLLELLDKNDLSGKPWARFRIETNLASVALDIGRESEAAERFETAYGLYPSDSLAIANLSLARLIQDRFAESMELAKQALATTPRADHAAGYLLQAAGRSGWEGDPESLLPKDLIGSKEADIGLAEFYRRQGSAGWAERVIEICKRHPDVEEFRRLRGTAVLAIVVESENLLAGGMGPVTQAQLNEAADDLKATAEHCLDVGFADKRDLAAYVNNAGVLLRLAGRHGECAALIERALPHVGDEPTIPRLLALARLADGRRKEAVSALTGTNDPESLLIAAEMQSATDLKEATDRAFAVALPAGENRLARIKWTLAGELALRLKDRASVEAAIAALRALPGRSTLGDTLEARAGELLGLDETEIQKRLKAASAALESDAPLTDRVPLAEEMLDRDLAGDAAALLEGRVDLTRGNLAAMIYLRSLANARRDEAFTAALAQSAPALRDTPSILWLAAAHAWNTGDLEAGLDAVSRLLALQPDNPRARLLRIDILLRQDRSEEVIAELEKPVEELQWSGVKDRGRIAGLLAHFGFLERGMAFAYKTYLEHRDQNKAWMTILAVVVREGRGKRSRVPDWDLKAVRENTAVDLEYESGGTGFVVVEPDAELRKLDSDALEPEHPTVKALWGKAKGEKIELPGGRTATIKQVRHKHIARFHDVLERYEERFPDDGGIRRVSVDTSTPSGLDEFIRMLKEIGDQRSHARDQYRTALLPIGFLASRIAADAIDTSLGLVAEGIPLKVATGSTDERAAAQRAIKQNAKQGCVLDLLALWTAWRLKSLETIIAECGPIHVPQSVMDQLRARRERLADSLEEGLRTGSHKDGKIELQQVPPEAIREWHADVEALIGWAQEHAVICPLVMADDLPEEFRDSRQEHGLDFFDSMLVAFQRKMLLVTDDLPSRQLAGGLPGTLTTWQHQIYYAADEARRLDRATYTRWTAELIEAGHNYISVSGLALAHALRLDADAGEGPGRYFKALARMIGGKIADPVSHVGVVVGCLQRMWAESTLEAVRMPAASYLLTQIIRERTADYARILAAILVDIYSSRSAAHSYVVRWLRGHFLLKDVEAAIDEFNRAQEQERSPKQANKKKRKK